MSAVSGIFYYDGRPISRDTLDLMALHCRPAGPDAEGQAMPAAGVAMQAHVRHFDRLSTEERQPLAFAQGSMVTWDGRLDNRDDLLVSLHYDLGPDITDAALVAAAYARWGLDCLPRLIGDWSLAIWDAANRHVVLARDYMGNRPLYYLELPGAEGIAWATNLDALADAFDLYRQPDEAYIAGKLTFGVPPHLTPFTGARRLRGGHLLTAARTGVDVRRYWTFSPSRIRYRDTREYTEHLRTLLTEGVRVRLRARGRVWAELSGGWDSSSVVCIANALIHRRQVEASELRTLSFVSAASPEADESAFIDIAQQWTGVPGERIEYEERRSTFQELFGQCRPARESQGDSLNVPVRAAGDSVVLSGELGDLVMVRGSSHVVSLLEPLHEGHPLQTLRLCALRARHMQRPLLESLLRLARLAYLPPASALARYERKRFATLAKTLSVRPDDLASLYGVTPALLARAPARPLAPCPSLREFPIVKRMLLMGLYSVPDHPAVSNSDLVPDIARTSPYSHRPLTEFIIGAPQLAFWYPTFERAGMQRALTGILPPPILSRTSKGDPSSAIARSKRTTSENLAGRGVPPEPAAGWELVKRGYVQVSSLERALQDAVDSRDNGSELLSRSVLLEAWLRSLDARAVSRRNVLSAVPVRTGTRD